MYKNFPEVLVKKIIIQFFLIILICFVTGCGNNKNKIINKKEAVEIEFWYGLEGMSGRAVEDIVAAFNSSQDRYFVRAVQQGNYTETARALHAAIISNTEPACLLLNHDDSTSLYLRGALIPLNGLMNQTPDFNKDDIFPIFLKSAEKDGLYYGIPAIASTQVLYYRKDMFREAGLSVIDLQSWEGLIKAAEKLTKRDGDTTLVYGWEPLQSRRTLIDAAVSKGGRFLSDDRRTVLIDSAEWIEAWELIRSAIFDKKIMKVNYGGQGWEYLYATMDDVMQGRAAGYFGSSGDLGYLDSSIIAAQILPGWGGRPGKPEASANSLCIPRKISIEKKRGAFEFITFFINTENTVDFSIKTGYIPVRKSAIRTPEFHKFMREKTSIVISLNQLDIAVPPFYDPTGGEINNALEEAAALLEIDNKSAEKVLKDAAD